MKKILYFIFILMSNILFAQDSNDTIIEPLYPLYSEVICSSPQIVANSFVKFTNDGVCYIRFTPDFDFIGSVVYLVKDGDVFSSQTLDSRFELEFHGIEMDHDYDIYFYDSCSNFVRGCNIDNRLNDEETIMVSHAMMDLIKEFMAQDDLGLLQFLSNDTDVNYFEKVEFVQKKLFLNRQTEFPFDRPTDGTPPKLRPPTFPPVHPTDECNCHVILASQHFSPGLKSVPGRNNNGHVITFADTDNDKQHYWKKKRKGWVFNRYSKGPAKHMDLWARGKRMGSRIKTRGFADTENPIASNKAQLDFTWLCIDGDVKRNCGCTKRVDWTAQYDTKLISDIDTPWCGGCGSKGGAAHAEDWAVLSLMDTDGNIDILKAGKASVQSECGTTWNKKFITSLVDVARDLAIVFVKLNNNTPVDTASVITNLGKSIKTLINTPASTSSACEDNTLPATLFDNIGHVQITPNILYSLRLYSYGSVSVKGFTSWNGQASVISDYNLAIANSGGVEEGQDPQCCARGFGQWLTSSFNTAPVQIGNLRDEIDGFMEQHQLPYDFTDYGSSSRVVCRDDVSDDEGLIGTPGSNRLSLEKAIRLNVKYNYSIINLDGRILDIGTTSEELSHDYLNNLNLNSGIYFIQYKNKTEKITKKVCIIK